MPLDYRRRRRQISSAERRAPAIQDDTHRQLSTDHTLTETSATRHH